MLAVSRITLHTIVSKNGGGEGGRERRAIGDVIEMSKSDSFRERDIAAVMRFCVLDIKCRVGRIVACLFDIILMLRFL